MFYNSAAIGLRTEACCLSWAFEVKAVAAKEVNNFFRVRFPREASELQVTKVTSAGLQMSRYQRGVDLQNDAFGITVCSPPGPRPSRAFQFSEWPPEATFPAHLPIPAGSRNATSSPQFHR